MRDPERIDRILTHVRRLWKVNPDLRFMQLVRYLYHAHGLNPGISDDYFYTEDEDLLSRLEAHLGPEAAPDNVEAFRRSWPG